MKVSNFLSKMISHKLSQIQLKLLGISFLINISFSHKKFQLLKVKFALYLNN